jgi:hypothetical protein
MCGRGRRRTLRWTAISCERVGRPGTDMSSCVVALASAIRRRTLFLQTVQSAPRRQSDFGGTLGLDPAVPPTDAGHAEAFERFGEAEHHEVAIIAAQGVCRRRRRQGRRSACQISSPCAAR